MRVAVPILVAALVAGCAAEAPQGPVLANPKVLVDRSATNTTHVYVHSAFGERVYDAISVRLDNGTAERAEETYALDVRTDDDAFHLAVDVSGPGKNWTLRALVDLAPLDGGEGRIALWDEEEAEFGEWRGTGLPWQKILDETRPPEEGAP